MTNGCNKAVFPVKRTRDTWVAETAKQRCMLRLAVKSGENSDAHKWCITTITNMLT